MGLKWVNKTQAFIFLRIAACATLFLLLMLQSQHSQKGFLCCYSFEKYIAVLFLLIKRLISQRSLAEGKNVPHYQL